MFGEPLQPGSEVYRISHDGISHAKLGTHIADVHFTARHADADCNRLPTLRLEIVAEILHRLDHLETRQNRMPGVIGISQGRAPKGHYRIAHILVDRAAVFLDHVRDRCQKLIHQARQFLGVKAFRDGRKTTDIGEQDREFLALAFERYFLATFIQFLHQRRRNVLAEYA